MLVYGDCAVNPDPTAEQLADIAISSAATAAAFGVEPRVAMLSYSTGTSGTGTDVEKVSEATALVRERAPDLLVEGPIQYDAAIDAAVARDEAARTPPSPGGRPCSSSPTSTPATTPTRPCSGPPGAVAVGPVLQGLRKPVNDLSRGATVRDIVNTVAITAIQAQALAAMTRRVVLVLNAGSSSLKYSLVDAGDRRVAARRGSVERIGETSGMLTPPRPRRRAPGRAADRRPRGRAAGGARRLRPARAVAGRRRRCAAVGHRVVHGGARFSAPAVVDDDLVAAVDALVPLAPLHNPANLEGIRRRPHGCSPTCRRSPSSTPRSTRRCPPHAYTYAVPLRLARGAPDPPLRLPRHVVRLRVREAAADCSAGRSRTPTSSCCTSATARPPPAVAGGRSVDTSMGLTPLEGLVMGTRSGDLDPALHAHLHRELGWSLEEIDRALNRESGLKGLSGDNDFREVSTAARGRRRARRGWPSTSTATGSASTSAPTTPCSAAWTPSCSPPASARTPPQVRAASLAGLERLGHRASTRRATRPGRRDAARRLRRRQRRRRARRPHQRGVGDRPADDGRGEPGLVACRR